MIGLCLVADPRLICPEYSVLVSAFYNQLFIVKVELSEAGLLGE